MLSSVIGYKIGRLTVISECTYIGKSGKKQNGLSCLCDCGKAKIVNKNDFLHGKVKSCGCLLTDFNKTKKGNRYGSQRKSEEIYNKLPYYKRIRSIWKNMRNRCNNRNATSYDVYGGRGVKVCNEWNNSFKSFYEWSISNGYDEKLSIDRINVNGNYEPGNCRWATIQEQCRNKRVNNNITINGVTHCLVDWAEILGISREKLRVIIKNL